MPSWRQTSNAGGTDPLEDLFAAHDALAVVELIRSRAIGAREVLELYASGVGAKEVAQRLFISEHTVIDHLRQIRKAYQRLGRPAHTKVELYQRGVEDGYVPGPRRD